MIKPYPDLVFYQCFHFDSIVNVKKYGKLGIVFHEVPPRETRNENVVCGTRLGQCCDSTYRRRQLMKPFSWKLHVGNAWIAPSRSMWRLLTVRETSLILHLQSIDERLGLDLCGVCVADPKLRNEIINQLGGVAGDLRRSGYVCKIFVHGEIILEFPGWYFVYPSLKIGFEDIASANFLRSRLNIHFVYIVGGDATYGVNFSLAAGSST